MSKLRPKFEIYVFAFIILTTSISAQPLLHAQDSPINGIYYPRIAFPAVITPSSELTVELVERKDGGLTVSLYDEFGSYPAEVLSINYNSTTNRTLLRIKVGNLEPGLYNLKVVDSSGAEYVEPNSVYVDEDLNPPITILSLTDTHYDNSLKLSENFKKIVQLANFLSPDIFVAAGDMVNGPREEYFQGLYRELLNLRVPILLVPGNHDHAKGRSLFLKYLAPSNLSLDFGKVHFICLDTGIGSTTGQLTGKQVKWLEEDLERNQDKIARILIFHHPLLSKIYPPSGIENTTEVNLDTLLKIVKEKNVNLVLNGHDHEFQIFHEPTLIIVDPCAQPGGIPYSGFRIIKIGLNGEINYKCAGKEEPYPLDKIEIFQTNLNDGSSYGATLVVENNLDVPVDGFWTFKLRKGEELKVENCKVIRKREIGETVFLDVKIHVEQGGKVFAKAYTKKDLEAPKPDITAFIGKYGEVSMVSVQIEARDDVLGPLNISLKYSLEGSKWSEVKLTRIRFNETVFKGSIQLPSKTTDIFLKCEVSDPEGHKSTFTGKMPITAGKVTPTPTVIPTTPPPTTPTPTTPTTITTTPTPTTLTTTTSPLTTAATPTQTTAVTTVATTPKTTQVTKPKLDFTALIIVVVAVGAVIGLALLFKRK